MAEKKEMAVEEKAKKPAKKETKKPEAEKSSKKATETKEEKKSPFLMYKGRPLVRSGNSIYYGKMNDDYVALFQIVSTKEENGMTIADKVQIQIISTDPEVHPLDRIIKKGEKVGLYNAMEIGCIWLERALAGKLS